MRNIFVEKSYAKCDVETVPRPFSKKPKLIIPLHQKSKVLIIQFTFIICQIYKYQNILKLSSKPLAFNSFKAFSKKQKRSGTSLSATLST